MFLKLLVALFLLAGCSPDSLNDFEREGERVARRLIKELEIVESREELLQKESELKKIFNDLVDLMIEAKLYQEKHLDESPLATHPYNDQLLGEMQRLYNLEGCREIMERAQREALIRLDAFERKITELHK